MGDTEIRAGGLIDVIAVIEGVCFRFELAVFRGEKKLLAEGVFVLVVAVVAEADALLAGAIVTTSGAGCVVNTGVGAVFLIAWCCGIVGVAACILVIVMVASRSNSSGTK